MDVTGEDITVAIYNEQLTDCTFNPSPMSISFSSPITGKSLGEFKEKDGVLTFEGDVDESGKLFVDFVCGSFENRIKELIKEERHV